MFEHLRELRTAKNITCEQMSHLLGLKTRSAYQKKEIGNTPFTLHEAKVIADYFGKNIGEIFFEGEVSHEDSQYIESIATASGE